MEVADIKPRKAYRNGKWVRTVTGIAVESWHTIYEGRHDRKIVRFTKAHDGRESAATLEEFAAWAKSEVEPIVNKQGNGK